MFNIGRIANGLPNNYELRISRYCLMHQQKQVPMSRINMAFEQLVALPILIRHALTDPMKNLRPLL